MKRGKGRYDYRGQPLDPNAPHEIPALQFMVEKSPGAFTLRFVSNEDLIRDLQAQGALDSSLDDAETLFSRFSQSHRKNTFPAATVKLDRQAIDLAPTAHVSRSARGKSDLHTMPRPDSSAFVFSILVVAPLMRSV